MNQNLGRITLQNIEPENDNTKIIIVVIILIFFSLLYFIYSNYKQPEKREEPAPVIGNKVTTNKPVFKCPESKPTIISKDGIKTCINEDTDPVVCSTIDSSYSVKGDTSESDNWFEKGRKVSINYKKIKDQNCNTDGINCCRDPTLEEMKKQCLEKIIYGILL